MAETEIDELAPDAAPPEEGDELDEENRLKPEFVRAVTEALEAHDESRAYELVEPLHPADSVGRTRRACSSQRPPRTTVRRYSGELTSPSTFTTGRPQ